MCGGASPRKPSGTLDILHCRKKPAGRVFEPFGRNVYLRNGLCAGGSLRGLLAGLSRRKDDRDYYNNGSDYPRSDFDATALRLRSSVVLS